MIRSRRTGRIHAFGVVETLFSILLVGGVLVAALNSVGAATSGRQRTDGHARGQLLAESLMTEILAQAYADKGSPSNLGPESGEAGANRNLFDDVDDYHNYTDATPKLRNGASIDGFSRWNRSVLVYRANPQNPNANSVSESGVKRIKVTVKYNGVPVAYLAAFKTSTDPVAGKTKGILVQELEMEPAPPPDLLEVQLD